VKLLIAAALVVGGIWAFYALPGQPVYVRAALPVVGVALAVLIVFYWCDFGRRLVRYVRDSVAEFKKVVWPPRKDAMRMTMFVVAFVAVLALFIYAADSLISWLFYDVLLKRG
jgi:preprotein translocase subunit SecE